MKKKNLKLSLSKETVAKLGNKEMNIIKGGDTIKDTGTTWGEPISTYCDGVDKKKPDTLLG